MQKIITFLLPTALFLFSFTTQAASFDCAKAKSPLEKTICSNANISKLDEEMSTKYQVALKSFPVKGFVRAQQREWLADTRLLDCKKDCTKALTDAYQKRIAMLSLPEPQSIYSNTSNFERESGDTVAIIYSQKDKRFISLWGGYRIHRQASNDAGKEIYTGCSFDGQLVSNNLAKDIGSKDEINLTLTDAKLIISDKSDQVGCEGGFASYSKEMSKIK
jgi:uncharacterized protein